MVKLYLNNYSFFSYLPGELRTYVHARKRTSGKLFLPYFNNIEITLIKIFAQTTEILGKSSISLVERNLSFNLNNLISLNVLYCVKILVDKELQEKLALSLVNLRKVFK